MRVFNTTFDFNMMKIQFFTVGFLINIIFYSCSAASHVKRVVCRNDNDIYGRYKLASWRTVEFRLYLKNGRTVTSGNIHVSRSKNVSCTWPYSGRKYISKSCTNWNFSRRRTFSYTMRCGGKK